MVPALWPVAAQAAEGGLAGGWPLAMIGGLGAALALAAAILVAMGWRISRLSRQGAAAAARVSGLLDSAADGRWLWPAGAPSSEDEPASEAGSGCTPALAAALGLTPDAGWTQFRDRLAAEGARELDRAVAALRRRGTPFDLTVEAAGGEISLRLSGRRIAAAEGAGDVVWVHDITASSKALAEAREVARSAARQRDGFKAMLDALPLPVWRRRADLRLDWCNVAYAEAIGEDRARVTDTGRELAAGAIDGQGRGLAQRARNTRLAQSESHPVVVDGARRLFDFTEVPLRTDGGEVTGMGGYALDCTGLEETQQELARHIAAHGEVLERLGSAVAIFGADMRLKFFNRAYVQLWGLDQRWLGGEPSLGEVLEALRERRRLPETGDFQGFKQEQLKLFTSLIEPTEELIYRPDDTTIRQVLSPHPFGGLIFIFEDVTDRLALERSFDTLSAVQLETINNLHEGVAVFGSDGRIRLSNPAFARLWGLTPEDLAEAPHVSDLAERAKRFFTPFGDWSAVKPMVISWVLAPEPGGGQFERADGSVLAYSCVPLPDGACLISYVDVTDSARVERALRDRNEALELADTLKNEFMANVSYELRTPLNVIIGFSEILARRYFGPLNEKQDEYTQGILESSKRLLALINDILDLASIEAGHMRLEMAPVELHQLLKGVVDLTGGRARELGLNLTLDCADDIGVVIADERRLKQAVFNLVSNAIKFTQPGGTVTVSGRRESRDPNGEVVLEVADNGAGIAEAYHRRVFEKFYRVDPQARESGTGLGLSLVKSLIELHGGRVAFVSHPDQGTRVSCHLPTRSRAHDAATDPPPTLGDQAADE